MTAVDPITVVPLARPGRADMADRWGPSAPYVEAVWLPVLGPASFLVWRHLARMAIHAPRSTVSREELSAAVGLGSTQGSQSGISRALRRLQRFGLVRWPDPDTLEVRCRLPDVSAHHLDRLHPVVRARHDHLGRRRT